MLCITRSVLVGLLFAGSVISVPLGIDYKDSAKPGPVEKENKETIANANAIANNQIKNMRTGFDKYNAGDAKATKLYEAAFGKNADKGEVDKTIKALETGTLRVKSQTHPFTDGEIAAVPWTQQKKGDPWIAGSARFSKAFHGRADDASTNLNNNGRAGTLIHEATHQLRATGDKVHKNRDHIIKATDEDEAGNGRTGYTSNANMHKTVSEVNEDTKFTRVRNTMNNMHDNAESYAVFASLCSQPGALRRRDLDLFRRALIDGDDDQLEYLARRNSCQLPPKKSASAAKTSTAIKATPGREKSTKESGKGNSKPSTRRSVAAKSRRPAKQSKAPNSRTLKESKSLRSSKPSAKGGKVLLKGGSRRKSATQATKNGKVSTKGGKRTAKGVARNEKTVRKATAAAGRKGGKQTPARGRVRTSGRSGKVARQGRKQTRITKGGARASVKAKGPSKRKPVGKGSKGGLTRSTRSAIGRKTTKGSAPVARKPSRKTNRPAKAARPVARKAANKPRGRQAARPVTRKTAKNPAGRQAKAARPAIRKTTNKPRGRQAARPKNPAGRQAKAAKPAVRKITTKPRGRQAARPVAQGIPKKPSGRPIRSAKSPAQRSTMKPANRPTNPTRTAKTPVANNKKTPPSKPAARPAVVQSASKGSKKK